MTAPVRLVLSSASAGRLGTLRAAGLEPAVIVSAVDEDAVLTAATHRYGPLTPADAALLLARAKCEDVASSVSTGDVPGDVSGPGGADLVLGCDSIFELDGTAYGKPADPAEARDRWRAMSGQTGMLHTGHWLIDARDAEAGGTGGTFGETVTTEVTFASMSEDDIEAYVATGEPLACAGAFTIDGYGGAFVTGVVGDPHNVVGLSLPALRLMLAEIGVAWPRLWSRRG
jgi:septum formation protein